MGKLRWRCGGGIASVCAALLRKVRTDTLPASGGTDYVRSKA
ncbi:hypothetical protein [Paenibacillus agricola]|nr:hypothetical protein [Paenibacillus agricola]